MDRFVDRFLAGPEDLFPGGKIPQAGMVEDRGPAEPPETLKPGTAEELPTESTRLHHLLEDPAKAPYYDLLGGLANNLLTIGTYAGTFLECAACGETFTLKGQSWKCERCGQCYELNSSLQLSAVRLSGRGRRSLGCPKPA